MRPQDNKILRSRCSLGFLEGAQLTPIELLRKLWHVLLCNSADLEDVCSFILGREEQPEICPVYPLLGYQVLENLDTLYSTTSSLSLPSSKPPSIPKYLPLEFSANH